MNRRKLLKGLGLVSVGGALAPLAKAEAACALTPSQTEGPFYPEQFPLDTNNDLTWVDGNRAQASGVTVLIHGTVTDLDCNPIEGAIVELWQACESGRYNHPGDTNSADLDPNFQYYGRMVTEASGDYNFLTIKPGSYPASAIWDRPPHLHMTISAPGFDAVTTQVYFAGEQLNRQDSILRDLTPAQRRDVVVFFRPGRADDPWEIEGEFNVAIGSDTRQGTPHLP